MGPIAQRLNSVLVCVEGAVKPSAADLFAEIVHNTIDSKLILSSRLNSEVILSNNARSESEEIGFNLQHDS